MNNIVPVSDENAKLCICPACPTYKKSGLSSDLFCGREKVAEKIEQNGCICPKCEIYTKYQLNQLYYCMKGKSGEFK